MLRIWRATLNSRNGLIFAVRSEQAIREELVALVISRLLHPFGLYVKSGTPIFRVGRVGGTTITVVLLITCAIAILVRIWRGV